MYDVRSTAGLTKAILDTAPAAAVVQAPGSTHAGEARPIAIVGVHGISPIQQYAFQDQFATALLGYLNACETARNTGRIWQTTVYWPRVASGAGEPVLKPSALRLYRDDEQTPEAPHSRVYDVYEGYWSPFSKDKTNVVSLLGWLLRITFLGTSSTARIPASWPKLCWDLGYIAVVLKLAALLLALALVAGALAWSQFVGLFAAENYNSGTPVLEPPEPPSFVQFAFDPLHQFQALPWYAWFQLALVVVVAYLLVQLYVVVRTRAKTGRRTAELRKDARLHGRFHGETIKAGAFHRVLTVLFIVLVAVLAAIDALVLLAYHPDAAARVAFLSVWVVAAVALLQGARALGRFAVANILGDIQVYTTHDTNAAFFAIREQIIDAVTNALLGALEAVDLAHLDANGKPSPLYEKIHLAGHSLGTTVGLDVLIRVRQFVFESSVAEEAWARVRSFTTFGTALEKTRFFFDVRNPTVSAAQQQWQNDVYGRYFTLDRATLAQPDNREGIFWSNHWYFRDIVANRIVSYKSDVTPGAEFNDWRNAPGDHPICEDNEIPHPRPFYAFVHSDYLGDPLFWANVGPIVTS